MKKLTKMFAVFAAIALLAVSCVALAACGPKEYVFEIEDGVLTNGQQQGFDWTTWQPTDEWTDVEISVEARHEYTGTEAIGKDVTSVGNFYGKGAKITFTITSSKECDATFTLRAASAQVKMEGWFQFVGMNEVDLSEGQFFKLSVNGTDVDLEGTLPGLEEFPDGIEENSYWYNFGTGTATIHLVKGENVIVLYAGEGATSSGVNLDNFSIKCDAKLTWEPTDNSDRLSTLESEEE